MGLKSGDKAHYYRRRRKRNLRRVRMRALRAELQGRKTAPPAAPPPQPA
ncbi:MAG: hypothetical protein HY699_13485 [Deltaproteobacteria bacterium]|nr:hypothetical protein [Deltaproteobacteria bacterium]